MSNFIDDSVVIDFELPKDIEFLLRRVEEYDAQNDYGLYGNWAETVVYVNAKEAYRMGDITLKQWETLQRRYLL